MCTSRTRQTASDAPLLTYSLIVAPAFLRMLGAWIDAGGNLALFWREALVIAGVAVSMAGVLWWGVFHPTRRRVLLRASRRVRQRLAYLTTLVGALLVGLFWVATQPAPGGGDERITPDLILLALTTSTVWLLLTSGVMQTSLLAPTRAWDVRRLSVRELNAILQLAMAAWLLLPTDLPAGTSATVAWLLPVQVLGVGLFTGQLVLHALRRPGTAVMVFAAVLFYRALANFVLVQLTAATGLTAAVQFLALAPAASLDATYMMRLTDADSRVTFRYALVASSVVTMGAALFSLPQTPGFPPLSVASALLVVALGAPVGLGCGWSGATIGRTAIALATPAK